MKNAHRITKLTLLVLLAIAAIGTSALAQEEVTYTWTAPTTGSAVDHYVVQHSVNGAPFVTINASVSTNTYLLTASYEDEHSIRVAGIDSSGRQGPWSVPSDPYIPTLGAPGQTGKPIAVF
jgi:hypothetical protein